MSGITQNQNEIPIARITQFFEDFKKSVLLPKQEAEDELIKKTRTMLSEYRALMEEQKKYDLVEAPEFNIFSLTGVMGDELFHSSFIANLLNPNGTHGQGSLFMNAFLRQFTDGWDELAVSQGNNEQWRVHTEMSTTKGRFDIVAMNHHGGMMFIIENKVYASEQETQLRRYYDWMKKEQRTMEFPLQMLYFLTPSGYISATLDEDLYVPLAYHVEIRDWLWSIKEEIMASGVKEIVKQYVSTVTRI